MFPRQTNATEIFFSGGDILMCKKEILFVCDILNQKIPNQLNHI